MLRIRLENLALSAYEAPPERLRPLVPSRLELDKRPDGQAVIIALFCNVRGGSPVLSARRPGLTVAAYAVCVRRDTVPGFYLLRSLLAPAAIGAALRTLFPVVGPASCRRPASAFQRGAASQQSRGVSYSLQAGGGSPQITLAPADESQDGGKKELLEFVTTRRRCHFWIRGRYLWWLPLAIATPFLQPAKTLRARLPLWQELGILSAAEVSEPDAAALSDSLSVRCGFPRPDLLI